MRDELHGMELVDRYLDGELSPSEQQAFEDRLRDNSELQESVNEQRALREGMRRLALRPTLHKAYRSYRYGKWGPWAGGTVVLGIALIGSSVLLKHHEHSPPPLEIPPAQIESVLSIEPDTVWEAVPSEGSQFTTDTIVMILKDGKLVPYTGPSEVLSEQKTTREITTVTIADTSKGAISATIDSLQREAERREGPWKPIPPDSLKMMWGDGKPTEMQ